MAALLIAERMQKTMSRRPLHTYNTPSCWSCTFTRPPQPPSVLAVAHASPSARLSRCAPTRTAGRPAAGSPSQPPPTRKPAAYSHFQRGECCTESVASLHKFIGAVALSPGAEPVLDPEDYQRPGEAVRPLRHKAKNVCKGSVKTVTQTVGGSFKWGVEAGHLHRVVNRREYSSIFPSQSATTWQALSPRSDPKHPITGHTCHNTCHSRHTTQPRTHSG